MNVAEQGDDRQARDQANGRDDRQPHRDDRPKVNSRTITAMVRPDRLEASVSAEETF